ncbi:MAG: competence/damage-inducible protein A [Acidobacteria bacterium]|nr:competence/damage-inducible protein A [Acidobacteriota bacterium]
MKAEIIAVGSELLTPFRMDTNSLFLTDELNKLGIEVVRKVIVGDDVAQLREAFREALGRVEVVIASGGLGPTEDDLTRETVAELLGRKMQRDEGILRHIQERFRRFGRAMPDTNARQADVPEGAQILENSRGTAPGLWIETNEKRVVILLPGPPVELKPMFLERVAALLGERSRGVRLLSRELRVTGMSESAVDHRAAPIYKKHDGVQTTILASPGEIQIHLRAWAWNPADTEKLLDELVGQLTAELGEYVFTISGEPLEDVVAKEMSAAHSSIAVAESCTGGLVAERLTNIPGSSSYFLGGVVCYANELKSAWADVPEQLIESRGAVSSEVAIALAEGIRRRVGAALGLGITGIAGPGGGTAEKPVGTVHIALSHDAGTRERGFHFPGGRDLVRQQASQAALDMVRRHLQYGPQGAASPARRNGK